MLYSALFVAFCCILLSVNPWNMELPRCVFFLTFYFNYAIFFFILIVLKVLHVIVLSAVNQFRKQSTSHHAIHHLKTLKQRFANVFLMSANNSIADCYCLETWWTYHRTMAPRRASYVKVHDQKTIIYKWIQI